MATRLRPLRYDSILVGRYRYRSVTFVWRNHFPLARKLQSPIPPGVLYSTVVACAAAGAGARDKISSTASVRARDSRVGDDVAHVEEAEERILPHRGSVHDMGPTLGHKAEVARLLEEGYLEPEICKKLSPVHDRRSVERYAQTYKNVVKLLERGFSSAEISGILSIGESLVEEYTAIVNEHHPEVIADNPHLQRADVQSLSDHLGGVI